MNRIIVVEALVPTPKDTTNLIEDGWSLALDQRAFGPRRTVVAFADADGTFRGLAHTERLDPPDDALRCCIDRVGRGSAAAIVYNDEAVAWGPAPPGLDQRFGHARSIFGEYGVRLVDWIQCDDINFRSLRFAVDPAGEWWDFPTSGL